MANIIVTLHAPPDSCLKRQKWSPLKIARPTSFRKRTCTCVGGNGSDFFSLWLLSGRQQKIKVSCGKQVAEGESRDCTGEKVRWKHARIFLYCWQQWILSSGWRQPRFQWKRKCLSSPNSTALGGHGGKCSITKLNHPAIFCTWWCPNEIGHYQAAVATEIIRRYSAASSSLSEISAVQTTDFILCAQCSGNRRLWTLNLATRQS